MQNIKAITKMTGLTSKTLRHWEAVGLLSPCETKTITVYILNKILLKFFIS
ncbi:MerR family DNA-binding transcriptional regulator [Lactococcus garvieae]